MAEGYAQAFLHGCGLARQRVIADLPGNSQSSLVLSIPSAALAVTDLADRIRKRRRAHRTD
jgi:hypothetical protein